jgi:aspartate aminotransferase/aminotransferase
MPKPAKHIQSIVEAMSVSYNTRMNEMRRAGRDVIVMSTGEAYFQIPLFPFDDLPMPGIYHYSHVRGIIELRRLLAEYYGSRYGVPVDPAEEIIITAGSKVALHMAFMAILDPGDEVLIPEPAWVSYPEQVRLCHGHPVQMPYDTRVSEYRRFVTPRTRAIVVNNPHNPSGWVRTRAELEEIYRLAEEFDLYVVADEAYSDFVCEPAEFISVGTLDPGKTRTVLCNTMSKNYGLSGWRVGYVITNPELMYQILKTTQHLITCASTILEWYLVKHFHEILEITMPQIREVVEKRGAVARMLDDLGLRYLPGEGTFYLFVSIEGSRLSSEEFGSRLLVEDGVCVVPGIGYGKSCDHFIRVAVGTESLERIRTGLERIAALVRKTAVTPESVPHAVPAAGVA